jgi:hypothetical protein
MAQGHLGTKGNVGFSKLLLKTLMLLLKQSMAIISKCQA